MTQQRPVDTAMMHNRPEKKRIRRLWIDRIKETNATGYSAEHPLYFTLPGSAGIEIDLLIENKIIRQTENGAIHPNDLHKIVALETSGKGVAELRRRYPGLNVLNMPVKNLVRGNNQSKFPDNSDEIKYCKAKIINLDLNEPLKVEASEEILFPVIEWIKKFSLLHKEDKIDWVLCLTLHGELLWDAGVNTLILDFLKDNCDHDDIFREKLGALLGSEITQAIFENTVDLTRIETCEMQKIAMVLIPKLLVQHSTAQGWVVNTIHNYSYSGGNGAPMVTWIIDFRLDAQATSRSVTEYKQGIRNIFSQIGHITQEGEVVLMD